MLRLFVVPRPLFLGARTTALARPSITISRNRYFGRAGFAMVATPPSTSDPAGSWLEVKPGQVPHEVFTKAIQKSPQDDREYRFIRLENGLQVMLVHDAKADKAAASLDVAVGHLYDPVSSIRLFRVDTLSSHLRRILVHTIQYRVNE